MTLSEKVLLVDDDPDHLSLVERYTSALGIRYEAVPSALDAVKYLQQEPIGVMVTDMVMPVMDGMDLLSVAKKHRPGMDVIVMTGYSKKYSFTDVINAGASDFIAKPFHKDEYEAKLFRLFKERSLLRELSQAKEKAESANKAITDFLHTIGHELRTPMNGIIGFTDLLREMELPEQPREFVQMISISAEKLMRLIEQLLNFIQLDTGGTYLVPSEFTLSALFDTITPELRKMAAAKGLPLRIAVAPSLLQETFFGDPKLVADVLNLLVNNAVKFSDHGEVAIEASAVSDDCLQFSVKDNGCGISDEQKEFIFAPFTQAESYMTRRHSGMGIGLAICKKLVRLLDGEIWVDSVPGKGSTFSFTVKIPQGS